MNPFVLILSSGGLIFCLAGYIQLRFPPKKINHLYGYRTSTSMQSQKCWDFAQQYSAKKMTKLGAYTAALGLLSWITNIQFVWAIWISIIIIVIGPILMLLKIEKELIKRFPKN